MGNITDFTPEESIEFFKNQFIHFYNVYMSDDCDYKDEVFWSMGLILTEVHNRGLKFDDEFLQKYNLKM